LGEKATVAVIVTVSPERGCCGRCWISLSGAAGLSAERMEKAEKKSVKSAEPRERITRLMVFPLVESRMNER